ncbi:MAG: lipid-A-disaccharide synthase N-terminal domain-containing protein [Paludibacter sp.]|jgi:lipid-A-disaccharide synthase-like uncharacterized protein|nr:lipid-A-disaccharide synthase N-terminal domain-containing protein [Paludibacter sp.]
MYIIGVIAQTLFSARTLFQWILSEKAKKVVSPAIFWILGLAASYLMFIYGWMREDFSILLGQMLAYYIYIWNLNNQGVWQNLYKIVRIVILLTPIFAIAFVFRRFDEFVYTYLRNDKVPLALLLIGSAGQVIFTFRFIYQFLFSYRRKESVLPIGFWVLSILGSSIIVVYAIIRRDPVLILGQSFGFIAYIRNLTLAFKSERKIINKHEVS